MKEVPDYQSLTVGICKEGESLVSEGGRDGIILHLFPKYSL